MQCLTNMCPVLKTIMNCEKRRKPTDGGAKTEIASIIANVAKVSQNLQEIVLEGYWYVPLYFCTSVGINLFFNLCFNFYYVTVKPFKTIPFSVWVDFVVDFVSDGLNLSGSDSFLVFWIRSVQVIGRFNVTLRQEFFGPCAGPPPPPIGPQTQCRSAHRSAPLGPR